MPNSVIRLLTDYNSTPYVRSARPSVSSEVVCLVAGWSFSRRVQGSRGRLAGGCRVSLAAGWLCGVGCVTRAHSSASWIACRLCSVPCPVVFTSQPTCPASTLYNMPAVVKILSESAARYVVYCTDKMGFCDSGGMRWRKPQPASVVIREILNKCLMTIVAFYRSPSITTCQQHDGETTDQ